MSMQRAVLKLIYKRHRPGHLWEATRFRFPLKTDRPAKAFLIAFPKKLKANGTGAIKDPLDDAHLKRYAMWDVN